MRHKICRVTKITDPWLVTVEPSLVGVARGEPRAELRELIEPAALDVPGVEQPK